MLSDTSVSESVNMGHVHKEEQNTVHGFWELNLMHELERQKEPNTVLRSQRILGLRQRLYIFSPVCALQYFYFL